MTRQTEDSKLERRLWRVSGRVQGVGFRCFVCRAAREIGVRGDVRNLADGRVEVRAEAEAGALERLRRAVNEGPAAARVDRLEGGTLEETTFPLDSFEIVG